MKIAITGHRPVKLGNDYALTSPLIQNIKLEIMRQIVNIQGKHLMEDIMLITGMALGIDTLFAKIAIELNFPFIAAIPCAGQASMWPASSKQIYFDLVEHPLCTKHWCSTEPYRSDLMQKRNQWMVDNCDILIAVWDGTSGGTGNCVKYAKSVHKQIIHIDPRALILKSA